MDLMTTDHSLHIARVVHWPGRGVLVLEALLRGLNRNIPRRWLLVSMYDLGHAKTLRSKSYFMILPRAPRIRRTNHVSFQPVNRSQPSPLPIGREFGAGMCEFTK